MNATVQESFGELLKEDLVNAKLSVGTIIKGSVVRIDKEYVTVYVGLKSEGAIAREQFENEQGELEVVVGDQVDVALEMIEDGYGETRLSREKAKRAQAWQLLEEHYHTKESVKGKVISRVKGGFTVDVHSLRAFLPGSLVDVRPLRDPASLEGQECEFKVIKMDSKRNNIVISRRAVLEDSISKERLTLLENLNEGDELEGVVKNLTNYGAFIDLGGMDGLLHITDISWKRINHPSELINIGDKINVVVLKIDRENCRVSLGMKQLSGNPWQDIASRYPVDTRFKGKVTKIADYGCFVELEEGIEGLVYVSEMDWTSKNVQPSKLVSLGQEVEVVVLEIDSQRHRVSLGMKQCSENPWITFAEKYKKGERINGVVRSITDFGLFIGLEGDIDGLIHISDIAWEQAKAEEMLRQFKKGQALEVVLLAIEPERERISLGIKQLQQDPFNDYVQTVGKGSIVPGKVSQVLAKGIKVELAKDVYGYVKASEISRKHSDIGKDFTVGSDLESQIININHRNREIELSIKPIEQANARALKDLNKNAAQASKTTLGDLLEAKKQKSD